MRPRKTPPSPLDPSLADALRLAQAPVLPPPARTQALRARILERAAADRRQAAHLTIHGSEGEWIRLLPGVHIKVLREGEENRSYLLRMAPGTRLPAHQHSADEECMVLEGEVWLGEVHAHAGDYHLARRGVPHGEVRSDTGCLLFLRGQKTYDRLAGG